MYADMRKRRRKKSIHCCERQDPFSPPSFFCFIVVGVFSLFALCLRIYTEDEIRYKLILYCYLSTKRCFSIFNFLSMQLKHLQAIQERGLGGCEDTPFFTRRLSGFRAGAGTLAGVAGDVSALSTKQESSPSQNAK